MKYKLPKLFSKHIPVGANYNIVTLVIQEGRDKKKLPNIQIDSKGNFEYEHFELDIKQIIDVWKDN